jgi:hypothetical protein
MNLELARGSSRRRFCQPRPDLLANPRQQLQEAPLKGRREKLNPLEGRFGHSRGIFTGQRRMVGANRADVFSAAHIGER